MHSSLSDSQLLDLVATTAELVEGAANKCSSSTTVGSLAWYVRKTLDAHAAMLWQMAGFLACCDSRSETSGCSTISRTRGGPGAAAPKPTHRLPKAKTLTARRPSDTPPHEEPPYEPPHDWSQDSDIAFQALTDEDAPPEVDFEDGIAGP